jgi:hypothetical protein
MKNFGGIKIIMIAALALIILTRHVRHREPFELGWRDMEIPARDIKESLDYAF